MKEHYHILNGDALMERFPEAIKGDLIVARECLVDGTVDGNDVDELYKNRTKFLNDAYGDCSEEDYYKKAITEFQKIENAPKEVALHLWFEDDLFCQVNLWFVLHLIQSNYKGNPVFLVRPKPTSPYSFGHMSNDELVASFQNCISIEATELTTLSQLWKLYQQDNCDAMLRIAEKMKNKFPFLSSAIRAHRDRLSKNVILARPSQTILAIMKDLNTSDFGTVFREFSKRESIYGFGDLQVKRLFDAINNKQ